MKRHWKKIVGAVVGLLIIAIGAAFIYAKVINKADPEFGQSDVEKRLAAAAASTTVAPDPVLDTTVAASTGAEPVVSTATTTSTAATASTASTAATATTTAIAAAEVSADGVWNIKEGSEVGYRVNESISGFDTTANGRTQSITGTMLADGTTITKGEFTVDMTTFKSDESRRDEQFNGRVMDVGTFPTSSFILTAPIDFGAIPPDGGSVTASATGDLTLHGTTKPVTFDVQGTFKNGLVGVLGQIPVVFADYGIPAPSLGPVKTEDNGLLEFVLVLQHE